MMHSDKKPRIAILSSGGLKAAWQVGALKALAEHGTRWETVCGCSAGAFNAAFLSMYNVGDEVAACRDLEHFWVDYGSSLNRPTCLGPRMFFSVCSPHRNALQSSHLLETICSGIQTSRIKASDRSLHILANSLQSGGRVFTKDYPHIREALIASMSVPGLFPAKKLIMPDMTEEYFVDGAVSTSVPHHLAGADADFDIIMASSSAQSQVEAGTTPPTLFETMSRSAKMCLNQSTKRAVRTIEDRARGSVNIYEPVEGTSQSSFYNMTPDEIRRDIKRGYEETRHALSSTYS